jgi:hypothetical protein
MTDHPIAPDPATQPTPLGKQDALIEEAEETGTVDPEETSEGAAQVAEHTDEAQPSRRS